MAMSVLGLMSVSSKDISKVIGEDRIALVQSKRCRTYSLKVKGLSPLEENMKILKKIDGFVWGYGRIPSGGGKLIEIKATMKMNKRTQTKSKYSSYALRLPWEYFKENIRILKTSPRDIQILKQTIGSEPISTHLVVSEAVGSDYFPIRADEWQIPAPPKETISTVPTDLYSTPYGPNVAEIHTPLPNSIDVDGRKRVSTVAEDRSSKTSEEIIEKFDIQRVSERVAEEFFLVDRFTETKNSEITEEILKEVNDTFFVDDPDERDSEWIGFESSDMEFNNPLNLHPYLQEILISQSKMNSDVDPYCISLMWSLHLFLRVSKYGGRWPFSTYKMKKMIKFRVQRISWPYGLFCSTFLIHCFITFISTYNIWDILKDVIGRDEEGATFRSQLERLEFDKYWYFAVWNLCIAFFVLTWNIFMILDNGKCLADFMSRWNQACVELQYVPTDGLRMCTIIWSFEFLIYTIVMVVLCLFLSVEVSQSAHGASGIIGLIITRNFFPFIRISPNYIWVRVLGLFYHLYNVYAAKQALLLLLLYSKIMENTAKFWNLRFAFRFDMLGHVAPKEEKLVKYLTVLSLDKLYNEHLIVSCFIRHTGDILKIPVNIYLMGKMFELLLLMYKLLTYILVPPGVKFKEKYVGTPVGFTGDRIRYRDAEAHSIMSCLILLLYVIILWFITSLNISACGEAIKAGLFYVNRQGLILCENAKERLFIQSLHFNNRPINEYFRGAWFLFNRSVILGLVVWAFVVAFGLLSLSPFLLQKHPVRACKESEHTGEVGCVTVFISRGQILTGPNEIEILSSLLKKLETEVPKREVTESEVTESEVTESEVTKSTPVTTVSIPEIPIISGLPTEEFINFLCPDTTALNSSGDLVKTQVLNILACDQSKMIVRPYTSFNIVLCFKDFNYYYNQVPTPYNSYPYAGIQHLFDCISSIPVDIEDRDDCGNVAFGNVKKVPVTIYYQTPNGTTRGGSICCYSYAGREGNEESLKYCHMQSPEQAYKSCIQNPKLLNSTTQCSDISISPLPVCVPTWNNENGIPIEVPTYDLLMFEFVACTEQGIRSPVYNSSNYPFCYQNINGIQPRPYADARENNHTLIHCDGNRAKIEGIDSCGNIGYRDAKQVDVILNLVTNLNGRINIRNECVKCFNYVEFGLKNNASIKHCHMQSTAQAEAACHFSKNNCLPTPTN